MWPSPHSCPYWDFLPLEYTLLHIICSIHVKLMLTHLHCSCIRTLLVSLCLCTFCVCMRHQGPWEQAHSSEVGLSKGQLITVQLKQPTTQHLALCFAVQSQYVNHRIISHSVTAICLILFFCLPVQAGIPDTVFLYLTHLSLWREQVPLFLNV